MLLGMGNVKAEIAAEVVKAADLKAGDQITLMMTPAAGNYRHTRYMCAGDNNNKMFTQEDSDHLGNIWTLVAAEKAGEFYLCHLATGKFAGVAQNANNDWMPLEAEDVSKMGIYSFLDKDAKMNVVIKNPGTGLTNPDKLCLTYQQDSHKIVRWGEWGAHGQWTVKRVQRAAYYLSNIPEGMAYTNNDRHLNQVKLNAPSAQNQSLNVPGTVYNRMMNHSFVAKAGETVKASVGYTGTWMNAYIYVDFDQDGAFDETNDLKSFTQGNDLNAPEFTIPAGTKVGHYAMRYKVDWDSKDPAGAVRTTNGLMKNRGALCDVVLNVHGDNCSVSVQSVDCQVTAENGATLGIVPFGQNLKVKVTAQNKVVTALTVRHGYNLEGPASVKGVPQYAENQVSVTPSGNDWTATIPAAYMDGEVKIIPTVRDWNAKVNVTVAENADCAVTAENGEALTTAPVSKDFKVKVVAKNHKYVNALLVRHGNNLEGNQMVDGVEQYKEDRINIISADAENLVTIPAAYVDADLRIIPVVAAQALIFADEFNGENMSQPDAVWHRSPRWGSVWNRLVSKQNDVVYLKDGNLVCRAIKNDNPLPGEETPNGTNMRTGAVETSGNFSFRYGKVECRAKANLFQGTFPAIWMMPADGTGGWPSCGEIDIFEAVNTEAKAHHTVHTNWTYNLKHGATHNENVNFDDYHVYGLEWDDKSLKFYLDGNLQWTYNKDNAADAIKNRQWPFNRNFYLILNQSVGRGNGWAKEPNADHTYEFLVDWIRVYQNPHHAAECELRAKIEEFDERCTHRVDDFREGTKVCEYTFDNQALAAARAVLADAANKTTEELKAALKTLDHLYVLNQPKQNHFYRMRCAGKGMKFVQSTLVDGKQEVKSSANGVAATFLYTDKGMLSYTAGQYCDGETLAAVGTTSAVSFDNVRNGRFGAYAIKLGSQYVNGEGNTIAVGNPTNDLNNNSSNWWLEEVDKLQVTFKGNESGYYATIYAPAALTIPAGVTAYTGKKGTDYVTLTAISGNVIPAHTAVLLKLNDVNDANKTKDFVIKYDDTTSASAVNDFVGNVETEKGSGSYYGLGYGSLENHKNTVGFYILDNSKNMKGFRARLAKEATQASGLRLSFDGESTGIEAVDALLSGKAEIYDMSGRRVMNPTKGLYVVNGKKVYFK